MEYTEENEAKWRSHILSIDSGIVTHRLHAIPEECNIKQEQLRTYM
jgi:hypothetical protein